MQIELGRPGGKQQKYQNQKISLPTGYPGKYVPSSFITYRQSSHLTQGIYTTFTPSKKSTFFWSKELLSPCYCLFYLET